MTSTAANMYRVGDYVYFEVNTSAPYQIRRIEELNKTPSGNVEAKVMCFYRRRDIAPSLLKVIDCRSGPTAENGTAENSTDQGASAAPAVSTNEESATVTVEKEEAEPMEVDSKELPPKNDTVSEEPAKPESAEPIEEKKVEVETPAATTSEQNTKPSKPSVICGIPDADRLNDAESHQLFHRELFLSRQIETLPATHIRGKCAVTLLNELETPESYLNKDDAFFYSLVYDPAQKTILADKGEIRVDRVKYQATVPDKPLSADERLTDRENIADYESPIYHPYHNLTDRQIDQFLIVARAVGTLARAYDMNSATKYTGLHATVASASRDVTLVQAMVLLHEADYDIAKSIGFLVPPAQKQWYPVEAEKLTGYTTAVLGGPLMCRDQLEEWSAAEANLFEEALEKYGKDFNDIRQDFLPWKSLKDIVEYYYMWKTTDRYIQQKRVKAAEAESRLKQVYIPAYVKPNPNAIAANNPAFANFTKCCEGCLTMTTEQWYAWGPPAVQLRLCRDCWNYWKKYGGLKKKHKLENFDKMTPTQQPENVQGMIMPRPGDRLVDLPDFGGRLQRCNLPGCGMQFANLQTLNSHLRRDHGLPWSGADAANTGAAGSRLPAYAGSLDNSARGANSPLHFAGMSTGPMRNGPKTRAPVFLRTTLFTKATRRLAPRSLLNPRHAARNPFILINGQGIRSYCQTLPKDHVRGLARVLVKMGLASSASQASFQCGAATASTNAAATGANNNQPRSAASNVATVTPMQQTTSQKRPHPGSSSSQLPRKRVREAETTVAEGGRDTLFMKWINTPDDHYFHRTKKTRELRRQLISSLPKKMGRQPYRMQAATAKLLAQYLV